MSHSARPGHELDSIGIGFSSGAEAQVVSGANHRTTQAGQAGADGLGCLVRVRAAFLLEPPFISTPGTDFGGVLFTVAVYMLVALGLNIVVGYAGLLDLGYVGFTPGCIPWPS